MWILAVCAALSVRLANQSPPSVSRPGAQIAPRASFSICHQAYLCVPRFRRTAAMAAPGKTRRGEGQWALGHREPLNPNERSKKDDNPLNVRARIENIYAHRGFASIDPADLRGRFRWYGLYTQRKPGIDGGRTATLEPEELDDEFFMLRIRIDGGAVTSEQLRVIGEISRDYARDTADITDRQNIQYHWIRIEDMPTIWAKLEAAGMTTMEACGDSPRV